MKIKTQKFVIFIYLAFLSNFFCLGQEFTYIKFPQGDWQTIKNIASKENKNIIVFYFSNGGNFDSNIENNVFSDKKIIDFFKEQYIFYRLEKEKSGSTIFFENCELLQSPTFIFFNSIGRPLHQRYSIKDSEELIAVSKYVDNPDSALYLLKDRYEKNPENMDLLFKYAIARSQAGIFDISKNDEDSLATKYFASLNDMDKYSQKNWTAIKKLVRSVNDPMFSYLYDNKSKYENMYGKEAVDSVIFNIIKESYFASPSRFQTTGNKQFHDKELKLMQASNNPESKSIIEFVEMLFISALQIE